ncbi:MAG: hypothetical protein KGR98_09070, partial [Verrucomicrobia bacterium]|nr:hypothetical protein [Verrucomicrobiota bacterium]
MKKILTTLSIAIMASGAFAQGTLWTLNGAGLLISTNGASIGQGTGSTFGPNSGGVGSYYFALLEDNSPTVTGGNVTGLSANPTDTSTWQFSGLYLTNLNNAAGFVSGGTAVPDSMWAPNTTNAFFVVGWSANFGNSWGAIYSALTNSVASGGNWAQE